LRIVRPLASTAVSQSDRSGKLSERNGDPVGSRRVDGCFLVGPCIVLHESLPSDDHLHDAAERLLARHLCEAENLVADGGGDADTVFVEEARRYRYVGPHELDNARRSDAVVRVRSPADLSWWLSTQSPTEVAEPFTYVVDVQGQLWLAPRRSEHIACAGEALERRHPQTQHGVEQ
jgi:hypothetical protein